MSALMPLRPIVRPQFKRARDMGWCLCFPSFSLGEGGFSPESRP